MKTIELKWRKYKHKNWCVFFKLDLSHDYFKDLHGVYIIWSHDTIVKIGSGDIKDRIADDRTNEKITEYPDLKITWARVNPNQMVGIEKYLTDTLDPVVGERFPDRTPIPVNLPWDY